MHLTAVPLGGLFPVLTCIMSFHSNAKLKPTQTKRMPLALLSSIKTNGTEAEAGTLGDTFY